MNWAQAGRERTKERMRQSSARTRVWPLMGFSVPPGRSTRRPWHTTSRARPHRLSAHEDQLHFLPRAELLQRYHLRSTSATLIYNYAHKHTKTIELFSRSECAAPLGT